MARTRRELGEMIPKIDVVLEVRDARAPMASANPILDEMSQHKPRLVVLNKADLADPVVTKQWQSSFKHTREVLAFSATVGSTRAALISGCHDAYGRRYPARKNIGLSVLVAGIPNVGKSAIINQLRGRNVVKAANKPGVTRGLTWIKVDDKFRIADTPGVLWPKFDNDQVGITLAAIGSVKDELLDSVEIAQWIVEFLVRRYPMAIAHRYKVEPSIDTEQVLEAIARKRGVLVAGGIPDVDRIARIVVAEFRVGKLGRISVERPD